MTELDRLPPDQRAVLSLVLDRDKSYGEVADMLAIPESAVRDRAHAALDALARDRPRAGEDPRGSSSVFAGATASPPSTSSPPSSAPREHGARATLASAGSRRGGALLLGAILATIVVAVILITGGGGKGASHTARTGTGTQSTAASSATKPKLDKTVVLSSAEPTLKANGIAYVLSERGRRAFYLAAQGLPPSSGFFYAVWLYNSPSFSAALGRAPTVSSSGRMEGGGPLPTNASSYHKLIVTRETSTHPTHPGQIVLSGPFAVR